MRQMNAGSIDALGLLYARYLERSRRVARGVCANREAAEEAVQEAFEGIWRSRATYDEGRGPVVAWAMSIVRYRALDVARKRDTAGSVRRGEDPAVASSSDQLVDDLVTQSEGRALRNALAGIPAAQREVIALAFYGQLSHSEIAEHLALPAGTVKGRMRLGLDRLRHDLEDTGA